MCAHGGVLRTAAQAARDQAATLTREELLWVLGRAKGDERLAISLAISQASATRAARPAAACAPACSPMRTGCTPHVHVPQASARRVLPVLQQPATLVDFDIEAVRPYAANGAPIDPVRIRGCNPVPPQVSAAMVRKVKDTLKLDPLKPLIDAIDLADEEARQPPATPLQPPATVCAVTCNRMCDRPQPHVRQPAAACTQADTARTCGAL